MTLSLLIAPDPAQGTVIFADPAGESLEPALTGLIAALGDVRRLVVPLPDDTTRRHVTPPVLMRSRHADLWHGLSEDERSRVVLAAGESAAYLAPLATDATAIVAVPEPAAAPGAWRAVLGPFAELDEVPDDPPEDRSRWSEPIESATDRLELVRGDDPEAVVAAVATAAGLGPQRAARVARRVAPPPAGRPRRGRKKGSGEWPDELLWSLSAPRAT